MPKASEAIMAEVIVESVQGTTDATAALLILVRGMTGSPPLTVGTGWAQVGKIIHAMDDLFGEELSPERKDALNHINMVVAQEISYCRREGENAPEVEVEKPRTTEGQRRAWAERHQAHDRFGQ